VNVQNWINLVCAVLLFISPWVLGFAGDLLAARTAWVGGIVIFVMALAALAQFTEWEEWIALIAGALVIISPWALGFAAVHTALAACLVLGIIVVLSSISELWVIHNSPMTAR
jgi:hypothetical protein